MNRSRLISEASDIRALLSSHLTERLGDWYDVRVYMEKRHFADRMLDRSNCIKKDLVIVKDIAEGLGKYYACNILHHALKSSEFDIQSIIAYQKHDIRNFALVLTARIVNHLDLEKPQLQVSIRTVIPEYSVLLLQSRNTILVDYKAPKIVFEYDGYKRKLSRLTNLVQSSECPDALRVLRI